MPVFVYTKISRNGIRDRDTIDASTVADARRRLRAAGIHVIDIMDGKQDIQKKLSKRETIVDLHKIKQRDLSTATWQLASLVNAGIPLVPALSALVEQLSNHPLAKVFGKIQQKVNEGNSLADVMEDYPKVFSKIYISMIRAGEATGTLENVLSRLAEIYEKRDKITNKVKSAMIYPLFMSIVGVAVVLFIFTFIVPSITKLFLEMNRQLPWPTVMLIRISEFFQNYFWILGILFVVFITMLMFWFKTVSGRRIWDRLKLKCPMLGNLILKISISRFSRTLAALLASGLSIVEALDLSQRIISNTAISDVVEEAKDAISQGEGIAHSLKKRNIFPPIVIHMIAAGEKSGSIEDGLANVANIFDNEVDSTVKALTSLLEPVMIILLGIIVGFIMVAILLPIFDINRAIV